jgi:hypoxanthine-guanine phosphoribosyltransferase
MIEELKDQIEYQKNKNIEKSEEISKNKNKLSNKLKENNIEVDIDKVTNSNQVALSLIERIEKNDLFENMLKDIEGKIKGNEYVLKGMEIYEDFYKSIYENLKTNKISSQRENENNEDKETKESSSGAHNKRGKKHQKYKKGNKNAQKEAKEEIKENKENTHNENSAKANDDKVSNFVFDTFTPSLKKFYTEGDYIVNSNDDKANENNRIGYINSLLKKYKMKYTEQSDIKDFKFNIVGDSSNSNLSTNNSNNSTEQEYKETCLLNHHERNLLLADIKEIILFLQERLSNIENNIEINLTMYLDSLRDFNLKYNSETMTKVKDELNKLVSCLTDKNFVFLCDIFNDENNIKNIIDMFNEIKIKNMKLTNLINGNEKKNKELEIEIKDNQKKINELRKATVTIKKMTEVAVTKLLKRKINIMGDEYLFSK